MIKARNNTYKHLQTTLKTFQSTMVVTTNMEEFISNIRNERMNQFWNDTKKYQKFSPTTEGMVENVPPGTFDDAEELINGDPVKKALKKSVLKTTTPDNCKCYARIWCGVRDKKYQSEAIQGNVHCSGVTQSLQLKVVYMSLPQMRCSKSSHDGDYCVQHRQRLIHGDIRDLPKNYINNDHINHFLGFGPSTECDKNEVENETGEMVPNSNMLSGPSVDRCGWAWIPDKYRDSSILPRMVGEQFITDK